MIQNALCLYINLPMTKINFYFRYDYENCESAPANKMMEKLGNFISDSSNIGKAFSSGQKSYTVAKIDNFSYTDPVDNSVSKNQVSFM